MFSKNAINEHVINAISEKNHFLVANDLVKAISEKTGRTQVEVKILVNEALSQLRRKAELISYRHFHSKQVFWGFYQWLDEHDLPYQQYLPL